MEIVKHLTEQVHREIQRKFHSFCHASFSSKDVVLVNRDVVLVHRHPVSAEVLLEE